MNNHDEYAFCVGDILSFGFQIPQIMGIVSGLSPVSTVLKEQVSAYIFG
jgi:hypothetical protein